MSTILGKSTENMVVYWCQSQETKEYRVVFKKRRLMENFDSLPYG